MLIKQISIFIENKPGRLAEVTGVLADENINIHAMSIADTTDFGILRLIVNDPGRTEEILRGNGMAVKITEVIGVSLENQPGSLAKVLKVMGEEDISIEYMYAFTSRSDIHDAMVILRLSNQETAVEKLKNTSIKLLDSKVLESLS